MRGTPWGPEVLAADGALGDPPPPVVFAQAVEASLASPRRSPQHTQSIALTDAWPGGVRWLVLGAGVRWLVRSAGVRASAFCSAAAEIRRVGADATETTSSSDDDMAASVCLAQEIIATGRGKLGLSCGLSSRLALHSSLCGDHKDSAATAPRNPAASQPLDSREV